MDFTALKKELIQFYDQELLPKMYDFTARCIARMESEISEDINVYRQKAMQYQIIADMCDPVLFHNSVFYYELGSMGPLGTGFGESYGGHSGGFTYRKNRHLFIDQNPALYEKHSYNEQYPLYMFCGLYSDQRYHFAFNTRPVLENGLKGLYDKAQETLEKCKERAFHNNSSAPASLKEEIDYLENTCAGLLAMKKISEKFATTAAKRLQDDEGSDLRLSEQARLHLIEQTASRVPWEAPCNFYEALCTVAFLQKILGSLEGVSISTMGRLDVLLYPFYERDIKNGVLSPEQAYDLISEFLILWDSHCPHGVNPDGYEVKDAGTTYTLGGCDELGRPVFNELTRMFLQATSKEDLIYPKIKCRFSADSPKEYLDLINSDIIQGRTTILYQNDDTTIPAFVRSGIKLEDARNYSILGCWEPVIPGCTNEHCGYINMLKIFELSVWGDFENKYGFLIEPIEKAADFEELYQITLGNITRVIKERCDVAIQGKSIWSKVDPLMLISSAQDSCLEKRRDYTAGGSKYVLDEIPCSGLPNVVDSLMVIKELCFDRKLYTLKELLQAVKANWEGFEEMRAQTLKCSFWGDEHAGSTALGGRLNHDLYAFADELPTLWDGKVVLGHLLFMEMPRWAPTMRATPDGRHTGDFFSRGLTPSILHPIASATSVLNTLKVLDPTELAANSVLNVNLPFTAKSPEICEAFVRAAANTPVQALQLNCVTKEELLDAQVHPEKHHNLIVRVCGFSARFTSLSKEMQEEFLMRNFYEN